MNPSATMEADPSEMNAIPNGKGHETAEATTSPAQWVYTFKDQYQDLKQIRTWYIWGPSAIGDPQNKIRGNKIEDVVLVECPQ